MNLCGMGKDLAPVRLRRGVDGLSDRGAEGIQLPTVFGADHGHAQVTQLLRFGFLVVEDRLGRFLAGLFGGRSRGQRCRVGWRRRSGLIAPRTAPASPCGWESIFAGPFRDVVYPARSASPCFAPKRASSRGSGAWPVKVFT